MKMDRFEAFEVGIIVGWLLGGAMIGSVVADMTIRSLHQEAIEAGVGEYDTVTGEFKWRSGTSE